MGQRYLKRIGGLQVVNFHPELLKRGDFTEITEVEAKQLLGRMSVAQNAAAKLVRIEKDMTESASAAPIDIGDPAVVFAAAAGIELDKADADTLLAFAVKHEIMVPRTARRVETIRKHIRENLKLKLAGREAEIKDAAPTDAPEDDETPADPRLANPGGFVATDAKPEG